jgi:hypothetical protein
MSNYWIKEIRRATKEEGDWVRRGTEVTKRYTDYRKSRDDGRTRFNILWANTETLRPSLISATPRPECRPRYKKKDPVARVAAKILERALEFSVDQYDFVRAGRKLVNDYLLPGRAVARIKYIPTFEKKEKRVPLRLVEEGGEAKFVSEKGKGYSDADMDDDGFFAMEEQEEVVFEEVITERVPWQWFRMEPADEWKNVNWIAFGAPYTKDEGQKRWGKDFQAATTPKNNDIYKASDEAMKDKVIVWEVWDKRTRKQYFVAEGVEKILEENEDPMELEDFFPIPEPAYAVLDCDSMVPVPEFTLWQDQADELDILSERIRKVTEAIKARGAYAGQEQTTLTNILDADDNQLVPVADWMAFIDKGGLDGLISWIPIEQFAKVLQTLEQQRAVKIQEIYELTGVSDILRGATDPRETAKAQSLKANFGNRRLETKQDTISRFIRDIYRIKAEVIAEQFDPETLRMMVGLEGENQLFDEAIQLIQNDVLRAFNVDIETDSTIATDEQREKEGLAEAMQATAGFVSSMFPLVQMGAIPNQVAFEILRDYFRKFRFGRQLDDLLEEFQQQQPPNAEQQQQQQEQQAEMQKMQMQMQMEMQKMQAEIQAMQQKAQVELQKKQQEIQQDQQEADQERRQEEEAHQQSLRHDEELHQQKVDNVKELGDAQVDVKRRQAQVNQSRVQE